MIKRIIAAASAGIIVLGSAGITAFAQDENDYYDYEDYLKEGVSPSSSSSSDSDTAATEKEKDPHIAYPVHSFDYASSDIQKSLYTGKYYKTKNAYFKDEALVYDGDSYYDKTIKAVQQTADDIGMNVAIFMGGNYRSDSVTEEFTRQGIIELFTLDYDQDSVFLYLDFEGQSVSYDYICTCHDAKLYYPSTGFDDRVEEMIEHMYKYLPKSGQTIYKSKVDSAVGSFTGDLKLYKNKGPSWESSYHNDEKGCYRYCFFGSIIEMQIPPPKYWYVFLGIGIIVGCIIAIFRKSQIRKQYKFRELQKASAYTSNNRIQFNEVVDQYMYEHTSKVYIPPSNSSGGSSGGGGGGGSFGGGGGHR